MKLMTLILISLLMGGLAEAKESHKNKSRKPNQEHAPMVASDDYPKLYNWLGQEECGAGACWVQGTVRCKRNLDTQAVTCELVK